ncbi:MAG: pyrroline-5-carboxylate reductase [Alphaproteobacteria bacterium]|nr:pyrroline-5-carboxylate reductase [Alphaproteobacteria bacterium]
MIQRLLLVGCGKMGGALLTGWIDRGMALEVAVVEPMPASSAAFAGRAGVSLHASAATLATEPWPEAIVFAVKPQSMDEVVPAYSRFVHPGTVFLSIAAGKPIAYFEMRLGAAARVVRAMPNMPAAVGRGMTVLTANKAVAPEQAKLADGLMAAVGEVAWVADEGLMDAVTAVSGSGPAYVFLLIECLAEAGRAAGLPQELALQCARATVAGAGELARLASEPAGVLRQNVTSPGGTTAAALGVLMAADGLQPLLTRAVAAATQRGRELA